MAALWTDGREAKAGGQDELKPDDSDPMQVSREEIRTRVSNMSGLNAAQKKQLEETLAMYRGIFRHDLSKAAQAKVEPMKIVTTASSRSLLTGPENRPRRRKWRRKRPKKMRKVGVTEGSGARGRHRYWLYQSQTAASGSVSTLDASTASQSRTRTQCHGSTRHSTAWRRPGGLRAATPRRDTGRYLWRRVKEEDCLHDPGLGHMQFIGMPMGAMNSGAHFQRAMDLTLAGLTWEVCLVYLDDILIFTETFEELIAAMKKVFERLAKVGLVLKWKKCQFAQQEIKFLGFLVGKGGVRTHPDDIEPSRTHEHQGRQRR